MDTPRDDEELTDEEPVGDDDPSEEEEFEALMAAASEQAAEGVVVPEEDDDVSDPDSEEASSTAEASADDEAAGAAAPAEGETAPAPEVILDELDDAPGDDTPPRETADETSTSEPVDTDEAVEADNAAARARAEEEKARAAASLASARSEARAPAPKEVVVTAPRRPEPAGSRNNEIARMVALVLAVAGLCTVSVSFLKLRERPPAPPELLQLPADQGPLQMTAATEVPAGVAAVGENDVGAPGEPPVVDPPEDTQVTAAPDTADARETEPLVDVEPDPEPAPDPDPEPPVVVTPQPAPVAEPPADADDNGGAPQDVVFAPEPPRERPLTAVEQLALLRGAASGEPSVSASAEPVTVIELSATRRRSLEAALATADREFVRALVEDAAGLPARVGNAEWARLRQTPGYHRTLQTIYDHVLSTDDKVRLVGGQRGLGEAPESTPNFVRDLELPPVDLTRVRDELWNAKSENITTIVQGQL